MKKFKFSSTLNPKVIEISANSITSAIENYYSTVLNLEYNPSQTDELLNETETEILVCDYSKKLNLEIFTTIHNIEPSDLEE